MVDFSHFNATGEARREELIRSIEHAVEQLSQGELEALYYDMLTKGLIENLPSEKKSITCPSDAKSIISSTRLLIPISSILTSK